jgi:hypothetical protein
VVLALLLHTSTMSWDDWHALLTSNHIEKERTAKDIPSLFLLTPTVLLSFFPVLGRRFVSSFMPPSLGCNGAVASVLISHYKGLNVRSPTSLYRDRFCKCGYTEDCYAITQDYSIPYRSVVSRLSFPCGKFSTSRMTPVQPQVR